MNIRYGFKDRLLETITSLITQDTGQETKHGDNELLDIIRGGKSQPGIGILYSGKWMKKFQPFTVSCFPSCFANVVMGIHAQV